MLYRRVRLKIRADCFVLLIFGAGSGHMNPPLYHQNFFHLLDHGQQNLRSILAFAMTSSCLPKAKD